MDVYPVAARISWICSVESEGSCRNSPVWYHPGNHMDRHALQNLENYECALPFSGYYSLSCLLPKELFIKDYPANQRNFWERIRKTRMDAGMQIKDLAALIGVIEETLIN